MDESVAHPDLCSARATTYHGSTVNDFRSRSTTGRGYLSDDPYENPGMHAWRKAIVRNCDGSLFMLNTTVDGRPMRGWANLVGVLSNLANEHELTRASEIVLVGCSAGAIAAVALADDIDGALRRLGVAAKLRVLADSGVFPAWGQGVPPAGVLSFPQLDWLA